MVIFISGVYCATHTWPFLCVLCFQQVDTKDQIFPLYVMQVFGDIPCVPGLFVAGVFSGALSTVSSGLNALAGVTELDVVEGYFEVRVSQRMSLWATKGFSVMYGVIGYGFIYVVKYLPGILEAAIGLGGMIGGPILGGFTLGMFFPWANSIVRIIYSTSLQYCLYY